MSIRARFVVALVTTLALALGAFACLSIVAIDRTLRSSLDANLATTAQAIAGTIDEEHGRPRPDPMDSAQIATLQRSARAAVLDARGNLVAGDVLPKTQASRDDVSFAAAPIVRKGRYIGEVRAWRSNAWIDVLDRDAGLVSLAVALLVLGIGALVAYRVAGTVVAPLDRVALLMERIEGRDLSLRVGTIAIAELSRFAAAFDRMLQRLESAFARERQFAADASHELRAPLAVVRAEAELALRRDRNAAEYRHAFEGVLREVVRIEMLVDDLLAAARADIDAAHKESIDIAAAARDVVDRCSAAARVKNVRIEAQEGDERLVVDPVGFERALLAIVHNAITFAPPNGNVRIGIEGTSDATSVIVRDDGRGFSSDALADATKRFWRADGARPRGGTGLGLAIARAIVEANGGTLILENADGGAKVSLRFSRSS
ncbi:MAG: HAMP domain-containing histidine kinase [Candidatus Eremiobacteraeota bacterium]|nr:HAMP domain-containing histidine kinase [Candidatus Eremiobacteraeota bacterium]